MRRLSRLLAGCLLLCATGASAAATLGSAQSRLSGLLAQIEQNFVEKEAIEMQFKVWQADKDAFAPRWDDLNRRIDAVNAECSGTFEHEEYERRKARCEPLLAQLRELQAQLQPEAEHIQERLLQLQKRDGERQQQADALKSQLTGALGELGEACAGMSPKEFSELCHVPPAPGPRTAEMVANMNAAIAGMVRPTAEETAP